MTKEICLCVHGHFYQPPRENPWTGEVELQESAAPYHDWNERIHHECYLPNTKAKVLDEQGNLVKTVNNFEKISFNIGPTLFSWLEIKHPRTYHAILKAEEASRAMHHGHGNAIAQVYNHMIMPLATRRDKVTQTKWGIYEFKHRFGREAEGIWLPETACNEETLEVLIEEGVKFTILAPRQAEAIRTSHDGKWHDVSSGTINTKVPYRHYLKKDHAKFINLFFYDGPIAQEVAFGSLAFEARHFADRLEGALAKGHVQHQLIHLATDGETFGHHKAFGERALAYLLEVEAPIRKMSIVNYAEFLGKNPPTSAVRLKEGEHGEGTSWSCAHGVKRWKDHCGCRGEGPSEWTQHWRKPLRDSLDWLREELITVYEREASRYLKDIWQARDGYIKLILDSSEKSRWEFFEQHAIRRLSKEEVASSLQLLEMQKYAMLMYTSCGWFFTELSGIETVQILQYAARAMELARNITQQSFEEEFLKRLSEAKSNVAEYKNGRGVYEKLVKPASAVRK
ncbi:MAG: hypothetical protein A3C35_05715 [Omnitrophica bacterium RIFCSPHIGHO2_02_FULL_46_11]|nr:MAG: hypothetical protein A3C35_05715 [Omnitrophica bacterium RIFCSPHIGHO2_02_FULL_46_11]OGW86450.1 MAG: hypothetical protein A3A81_02655 [Omnitrophica bacterium RIFCSPLOWO2_01_FULL_45_10b]